MTINLEFDHFEPDTAKSGETINAEVSHGLNATAGTQLGAIFLPQGAAGAWRTGSDVRILDDYPQGFSKYSLVIPGDMDAGKYIFKIMVRLTFKDKPEQVVKIESKSTLEITSNFAANLIRITPHYVNLGDFESRQYRVMGDHLEKIDTNKPAFLENQDNNGRMRIRQINDDTLLLLPAFKGEPLKLGRFRVLAYQKDGQLCHSSAFLAIDH